MTNLLVLSIAFSSLFSLISSRGDEIGPDASEIEAQESYGRMKSLLKEAKRLTFDFTAGLKTETLEQVEKLKKNCIQENVLDKTQSCVKSLVLLEKKRAAANFAALFLFFGKQDVEKSDVVLFIDALHWKRNYSGELETVKIVKKADSHLSRLGNLYSPLRWLLEISMWVPLTSKLIDKGMRSLAKDPDPDHEPGNLNEPPFDSETREDLLSTYFEIAREKRLEYITDLRNEILNVIHDVQIACVKSNHENICVISNVLLHAHKYSKAAINVALIHFSQIDDPKRIPSYEILKIIFDLPLSDLSQNKWTVLAFLKAETQLRKLLGSQFSFSDFLNEIAKWRPEKEKLIASLSKFSHRSSLVLKYYDILLSTDRTVDNMVLPNEEAINEVILSVKECFGDKSSREKPLQVCGFKWNELQHDNISKFLGGLWASGTHNMPRIIPYSDFSKVIVGAVREENKVLQVAELIANADEAGFNQLVSWGFSGSSIESFIKNMISANSIQDPPKMSEPLPPSN